MEAIFDKANKIYTDSGSEKQVVASKLSKYINNKGELRSLVVATGKGLK